MSKENFFETVEIDKFIQEVGECIFEINVEEEPLRESLRNIIEIPFKQDEYFLKEGFIEDEKCFLIPAPFNYQEKKLVNVFILSSAFEFYSKDVSDFEKKITMDLSFGRTKYFHFNINFLHVNFENIEKIFNKSKAEKVVILFLSDFVEDKMKEILMEIKRHPEFNKNDYHFYYQGDKNIIFFENRIDFIFNFIKYDLMGK